MSRRSDPIQIVVHSPASPEGKTSLSHQVAMAHAEQIRRYVQRLDLPGDRKKQLVDAVLASRRDF